MHKRLTGLKNMNRKNRFNKKASRVIVQRLSETATEITNQSEGRVISNFCLVYIKKNW